MDWFSYWTGISDDDGKTTKMVRISFLFARIFTLSSSKVPICCLINLILTFLLLPLATSYRFHLVVFFLALITIGCSEMLTDVLTCKLFQQWHKNSVVFLKDNFKCQRSHQTEHQFRSANTGGARFLLGEIKDWQFGWLRMLRRLRRQPLGPQRERLYSTVVTVHWRGICPSRGSKAPLVVSVIGMAEDIREWLSRSYKILRKEEQNGTNLGKTAWIDKFYHFLTFKYSCTIRTLRKVGTDATTTLNEGLFAGGSKAYFRFTK